jgi:hypothetical protein
MFVLSAAGAEPEVQRARAEMLVRLCGNDAFEDIICIGYTQFKRDKLVEMGAGALIDDGLTNIAHALEAGIAGIFVKAEQNAALIDALMAGKSVDTAFWHFDDAQADLVREKAIIANGWPEIVSSVGKL